MSKNKSLAAPEEQSVAFVELFFDLVFVSAVTQIAHHAAHHFDGWSLFATAVVAWLVWWAWTQFTWALNAADTGRQEVRIGVLVSTGVAFLMAVAIPEAFDEHALLFAASYVVLRLLGLGLYYRVASDDPVQQAGVRIFAIASLPGLALVLGGAFASPSIRPWLWLGVIGLDVVAAVIAGRHHGWKLQAGHFAERHGLIVIIALGESLIVAGAGVQPEAHCPALLLAGVLAAAATCLSWWTYFGWIKDAMEERLEHVPPEGEEAMARDVYSFWHFPLICGVICFAVGLVGIVSAEGGAVSRGVAAALGIGAALFVASTAVALHRATGIWLWPRLLLAAATAAAVYLAAPASAALLLALICVGLVLIIVVEHVRCDRQRATKGHLGTS